jgi:hypothetical protein
MISKTVNCLDDFKILQIILQETPPGLRRGQLTLTLWPFDGAECCDLIGLFLLDQLNKGSKKLSLSFSEMMELLYLIQHQDYLKSKAENCEHF